MARRFQKVDVTEPSVEDTYGILKGLKGRFEQHHHIEYSDEALRAAAELAARYINDRHMPDKAIDVIDEAGAYQRLQPEEKRVKRIEVAQVEDIVAKIARIPPKHVTTSDKELLRNLERDLKLTVFGQDDAIESLSTAIKLSRAGPRRRTSRSAHSSSPVPPAWARPRWRGSWRRPWVWSWCASTCPSTWSGIPCRG